MQMQERMAAMQEAMKRPEMQQQMQQMMAMAQNQQMQQRMAALKEDPEMAPIFEEIQKVGAGLTACLPGVREADACTCRRPVP
jgi:hypothetical protein